MASSEGPSSAAEPAPKSSNGVGGNGPNGSAQHANGLLPGPPLTTTMAQGSFISRVRQHSFMFFFRLTACRGPYHLAKPQIVNVLEFQWPIANLVSACLAL